MRSLQRRLILIHFGSGEHATSCGIVEAELGLVVLWCLWAELLKPRAASLDAARGFHLCGMCSVPFISDERPRARYSSLRPVFLSKGSILSRDKPSGRSDSSVWNVSGSGSPCRT